MSILFGNNGLVYLQHHQQQQFNHNVSTICIEIIDEINIFFSIFFALLRIVFMYFIYTLYTQKQMY